RSESPEVWLPHSAIGRTQYGQTLTRLTGSLPVGAWTSKNCESNNRVTFPVLRAGTDCLQFHGRCNENLVTLLSGIDSEYRFAVRAAALSSRLRNFAAERRMTLQSPSRLRILAFLTVVLGSVLVAISAEESGSKEKWVAPAAEARKKNPVAVNEFSLA